VLPPTLIFKLINDTLFIIIIIFKKMEGPFDKLVRLYEKYGNEEYMIGEKITQKEHVLQAAKIATICGAPNYIIMGLLWHDCGQIIEKDHVGDEKYLHSHHAEIGYKWLIKNGYSSKVANIARYHTIAKVILCSRIPNYYDNLSNASKESYEIQKIKHKDKIQKLVELVDFEEYLFSRMCDDMAKLENMETEDFEFYRKMSDDVLSEKCCTFNSEWKKNIKKLFFSDAKEFETDIRIPLPN
jgi:predicted HD phosphohydrolase